MSRRAEPEPSGGGAMGRVIRWTLRAGWIVAAWISAPLLIVGLGVRLTVRDHFDRLAVIFYATPWPVLMAMALICLIHWWGRPLIRWTTMLAFAGCLTIWIVKDFGFAPENLEHPAKSFRIAYWNIARPGWRLNGVLAQSAPMSADFYVFGEHRPGKETPSAWTQHFSGRQVLPLARELLLVSPEPVRRLDGGSLGGAGGFQLYRAQIHGREFFLLMVDFTATLHKSRRPAFDRLFQIVDAYAEKPLVLLGDFNTPPDSVHFDRLRTRLTSAFETTGRGYGATWPMPTPVMQLDQVWTTKHLRILRCEHVTSLYSDHRAVTADLAFP